jgi:hypothetical protein
VLCDCLGYQHVNTLLTNSRKVLIMPTETMTLVEAAIATLKTDIGTIGGAMFLVTLVIVAFAMFRRSAR